MWGLGLELWLWCALSLLWLVLHSVLLGLWLPAMIVISPHREQTNQKPLQRAEPPDRRQGEHHQV